MERNTRSKSKQEYVKALIQGLSLQRLTDQEIVDYLHNEKGIEIARTTVNATKNRIEPSAEKWYVELRQSSYKYIALTSRE
jgi:DNA-directed RNA polymerase specialized sigma54-like protein